MHFLDDFFANDVSVADATIHLWGDLAREALLAARARPSATTLRAAREALNSVRSALAHEAFLARPLSRKGQHEEALSVRLEALRFTPRWDPFQSGVILHGLAESLCAVGRDNDALLAAREGFRHAPLDPYVQRAWADAARRVGAKTEAAAVHGWLRDMGYGKPIVTGPPTDEERTTEAAPLPIDDVTPLGDEDLARYLVLSEVDEGFDSKRYRFARHAMAMIRRRELGLARNTAAGDAGDSGLATTLAGWMNLAPPDEVAWLLKDSIRRTLTETPEGAKAKTGSGSKKPNRYWSYDALAHIGYRNQLVKEGTPHDLEALLFCPNRPTFVEGLFRLPHHPVATRFKQLRDELLRQFPAPEPNQVNLGTTGVRGTDGKLVSFPIREDSDGSEFPPRIEWVADARQRCGACKKSIEKGACALRTGKMSLTDGEPKWKVFHVTCAAEHPSAQKPLRQAIERERRSAPELTAAMARS